LKAIIGLGNPGNEYARTRHNVGFAVVDALAARWRVELKRVPRRRARVALVRDRNVLLGQPQTFMNLSGVAVGSIMTFYKLLPSDVLVVVDEVQLPLGKLRLRGAGSAGGHNGLKSIIEQIGDQFPRLRIGVGRGNEEWGLSDHVLGAFQPQERQIVEQAITRAADAAETFVTEGLLTAMNRYNAPEAAPNDAKSENLKPEL
jgi:PTH1 family peptidyl-tRNA hydrolase